jgi:phenylacetate-CoA ligase
MSQLENASRSLVEQHQLARLQLGLTRILPQNRFYEEKLFANSASLTLQSIDDLSNLPFTTKQELVADQELHPLFGSNVTYPLNEYIRLHQTSGTTGRPLKVLDTLESWDWWADCWTSVYQAAGVTRDDIVFLAFSFGPFIGFWSAYEGAKRLGALTVPGGGMDSLQRLKVIQEIEATVLVCTPSYALHLAEVAQEHGLDMRLSNVRITIHAGEPGASIPATRERIQTAWNARTYDHAGMTEMGAFGFACEEQLGLHVNEGEFIAEILDPVPINLYMKGKLEGDIDDLGRWGNPAIRYRTGDLVPGDYSCACGARFSCCQVGFWGE